MARYPVDTVSIASGFGPRVSNGKPQNHYAYDLAGKQSVHAPEGGTVSAVWSSPSGDTRAPAPWDGYGPGGVEIAGVSGMYHVLAHLDPASVLVAVGDAVVEGQTVGVTADHVGSAGPHVHWEVRDVAVDDGPSTRDQHTVEPAAWLTANGAAIKAITPISNTHAGQSSWLWWAVGIYLISRG